jgi:hypothetical protein
LRWFVASAKLVCMSAIIKLVRRDGATKYIGQVEVEVTEEDRKQARADGIQDMPLGGAYEVANFDTLEEASEHAFPDRETAEMIIKTQLPKLQNTRYKIVEVALDESTDESDPSPVH